MAPTCLYQVRTIDGLWRRCGAPATYTVEFPGSGNPAVRRAVHVCQFHMEGARRAAGARITPLGKEAT